MKYVAIVIGLFCLFLVVVGISGCGSYNAIVGSA